MIARSTACPRGRVPRGVAAAILAVGALALAPACAPIIGLDDEPGAEIDAICACQEFNFAPSLATQCRDAAALPAHQTPEFLQSFIAEGAGGVSCPDCTHLQECLERLELDERYIPCDSNSQCAGNKCCTAPGQEHATCCSTCAVCT